MSRIRIAALDGVATPQVSRVGPFRATRIVHHGRLGTGRRPPAKGTAPDLGPHAIEIAEHLERVRQHAHLRFLAVVPFDRHFAEAPALGAGAGEQLDVEAQPSMPVVGSTASAAAAVNILKPHCVSWMPGSTIARTRVLKTRPRRWRWSGSPIRTAPGPSRLPMAMSHCDGSTSRKRVIWSGGIDRSASHRKRRAAVRGEQAVAQRRALAAVRQAQAADARLAGGGGRDDGGRVVGGAVVGDEDLPRQRQRAERRDQAVERRADPAGFVVGRDDDGEIDRRRRHEMPPNGPPTGRAPARTISAAQAPSGPGRSTTMLRWALIPGGIVLPARIRCSARSL